MLPFTGTVKMKRNLSAGAEKPGETTASREGLSVISRAFLWRTLHLFWFFITKRKGIFVCRNMGKFVEDSYNIPIFKR